MVTVPQQESIDVRRARFVAELPGRLAGIDSTKGSELVVSMLAALQTEFAQLFSIVGMAPREQAAIRAKAVEISGYISARSPLADRINGLLKTMKQ